jgi:ATP-binding cassette, subfamily B, bacterial
LKNPNIKSLSESNKLSIKETLSAYKYIPRFLKEIYVSSKKYFWINIICRLILALLPMIILWIGKNIVDEIIFQSSQSIKIYDDLWKWIGIEFALIITNDILSRLMNITDGLMGDLYNNTSSVKLIQKTKSIELSSLEDPDFYDKLNLARTQTAGRVMLLSNIMGQLQDFITMISLIMALIVFEPWLILLVVVSVIPSLINELKFTSSSYSLAKSWTSERRELDYLRFIGVNDKTAKEIKLFSLADFIGNRFSTLALKYYEANKKLVIKQGFRNTLINGIGTICYYGAYVLLIMRTVGGLFSLGQLTFLSTSFNRLKITLQSIFVRFARIAENALYLQDYFEFIDYENVEKGSVVKLKVPDQIKDGFEFRNVSFAYPESEKDVLKDVSFKIKAGEKIAFVGENGSGKTTLIKLMLKFYEPKSGSILLDGIDINNYNTEEYQEQFGVIFQDFIQYEFTIGENIAIGKIEELNNLEAIEEAADKSLAGDFVQNFEKKFSQQLGKRFRTGKELSGGQWQKIALARAYMKNAKVMILDEPTSALDARAEYEAFQRFIALTKGRTSVIISHRFSTVRMADRIVVLKNGVIHELGTHEDLMDNNDIYAELFNLQAAGYQ